MRQPFIIAAVLTFSAASAATPALASDFGLYRPDSLNSIVGRQISRDAITNTYRHRPVGHVVRGDRNGYELPRQ